MTLRRAAWSLFSIHRSEFGFVVPLFLLYFISNSCYTVGQIYSETLFINTYGAAGFSGFFIQSGIALILGGICYNYFILKIDLNRGYIFLVMAMAALIGASVYAGAGGPRWLPFYVYLGNFLSSFFLDIHFFNYAYQYLNIRNSKRIIPFLIGGGKLGGIAAGAVIFFLFTGTIENAGPYLWGTSMLMILLPLIIMHAGGVPRYRSPANGRGSTEPEKTYVSSLKKKIRSAYSSPIFTITVAAVFIMAVLNQVSEYYVADIFNRRFPTRSELASFLSVYSFAADFITLAVATTLTARIIQSAGVPKSNAIYPVSFLSFFILLIAAPGLGAAILMRFNKKSLSQIIRAPVFNIIMASSPRDRMAEVKSFITGIVNPMGMMAGGGIIFVLHSLFTPLQGILLTLVLGALYILLSVAQNRAYIGSLRSTLFFGNYYDNSASPGFGELLELVSGTHDTARERKVIEDAFNAAPAAEGLDFLMTRYGELSALTREQMLLLLKTSNHPNKKDIAAMALDDRSPLVRSLAYSVLKSFTMDDRRRLLEGKHPRAPLAVEPFCIRYLTEMKNGESIEEIEKTVEETMRRVLLKEAPLAEFIMLLHVLPFELTRGYAMEVAVKTSHPVMLKNLLPRLESLDTYEIANLLNTFIHSDREMIVSLYTAATGITSNEIIFLLDSRTDLTEKHMDLMFRYRRDDTIMMHIADKLAANIPYERKANYLKYIMATGQKPAALMRRFLESEIAESERISGLRARLAGLDGYIPDENVRVIRYLIIAADDALALHRFLMMKSLAILTGTHIDDVYEANILLKDADVSGYLMEYLESTGRDARGIAGIFSKIDGTAVRGRGFPMDRLVSSVTEGIECITSFTPPCAVETKLGELGAALAPAKPVTPGDIGIILNSFKERDAMLNQLEKIILLRENPLFAGMPLSELIRLAGIAAELKVEPGALIIKEGDQGDELFIVIEGNVEVLAGKSVVSTLGAGACIGELSVIDTEPRSSSVRTTGSCRMLSIKRKDFLIAIKEEPSIAVNVMKILAERLRYHLSRVCAE